MFVIKYVYRKKTRGGMIAQSVEQWSRNPVTRVRNQGDALVSFGKALILIYQVPRRGPKAVGRLVAYLQAFMLS